jgi:hypothetical protein
MTSDSDEERHDSSESASDRVEEEPTMWNHEAESSDDEERNMFWAAESADQPDFASMDFDFAV